MAWLKTTELVLTDHAFIRYNERVAIKTKEAILEEARHSDKITGQIKNVMFKKDNKVAYREYKKDAIFIIKPEKGVSGKFIIVTVLSVADLNKRQPTIKNKNKPYCLTCTKSELLITLNNIGYCYDCNKEFKISKKIKYITKEM